MHHKPKVILRGIQKSITYAYSPNDLSGIEAYEEVKKLPAAEQKELVIEFNNLILELAHQQVKLQNQSNEQKYSLVVNTMDLAPIVQGGILRKKLNYTETEWITLIKGFKNCIDQIVEKENFYFTFNKFPVNYAIKQIEYYLKKNEPSETLVSFIKEMLDWPAFSKSSNDYYYGSDMIKAAKKLKSLLNMGDTILPFQLKSEDIGDAINEITAGITKDHSSFYEIFYLASDASGGKPAKKFSTAIQKLQDQIGLDAYRKIAQELLKTPLHHNPSSVTHTYNSGGRTHSYVESVYLSTLSQQFIKGIVWTMDRFSDKETINILTKLCEKAYTKIPGKGPAAASIGNACVFVLGNMRGKDGLGALSRLKLKVRQNNVRKTIDKYLLEGAKKYNVSVEELKEMAVPDFQLEQGSKLISFEDYQLKVFIDGRKVSQQWIKPDGTFMKTVPSSVKKNASLTKQLATVRKEVKEIQKVYSAQKQRIDNQLILNRTWDFPTFQKYYLHHGLVYPITSKLVWSFTKKGQTATAILQEGEWYTVEQERIDWIDADTQVQLWHPVNATEATIVDWREKMIALEWKQPIKQAFREIYILTDAEINTRSYSNRMAAHILKQHQFNSLASLRGWKYSLMGAYDDGRENEICAKHLPEYNITAEYWIDEMPNDDSFNDTGIWYYIATDQVKFKDGTGNAMELVNVPKIVFSEIMRDVDLFVGVCSVGNDPLWMDSNGERQTNRDYWTSYSFGDLTEIAKTRKTILERLLPRLKKIRDNAHIDGKFLVVKGKLRTYKIHIGSGNILMEPNDQYLCIVPARSAESTTDRIFIPFEGDKGLSIVLSKAFLLAEDDKIEDSTITSQIKR
ncbi:MAG: DUF4132 domain-containing protein [Saprospiraceae bacterium]